MASKGYTNKTAVENYILQNIDSSFDSQLDSWISGIEQVIDQITGRNFIADSTASARLFGGDDEQDIIVDECVEVTKVEVGLDSYGQTFQEISASGADRYFLQPDNYSAKGVPIHKIVLNARVWPAGIQNNRITAKWGYSAAVPDDIKFAATVMVAGVLNQHRQGGDQIKSERIGNYQVTYNSEVGNDSWGDFQNAMQILRSRSRLQL